MRHCILFALVWLGLHSVAAAPVGQRATTEAGPETASREDYWYVLHLQGKPAGYLNVLYEPRKGGGWTVTTTQKLVLKRANETVEIAGKATLEEDADGRVVAFRLRQKQSKLHMDTVGVRKGDVFEVKDNGRPRSQPLKIPANTIGLRKADQLVRENLKKEGDVVEYTTFAVEVGRAAKQRVVAGPMEEVEVSGVRQRLRRMSSTQDIIPGVVLQVWIDENYVPWKLSMPLLGLQFVFHRTTREVALAQRQDGAPEVFLATAVPVDKPVSGKAMRVRYRLVAPDSIRDMIESSKEAAGHAWTAGDERTATLDVRRVTPKKSASLPVKVPEELKPFLAASHYLQSDDPKIRRVAAHVTGEEKNAWKAARKLARWVNRNVTSKNLSVVFATASEVLETRGGDCSEHAVLLAALCRASGIPARIVCGLLYYERKFVGHMWTEVFVGEWVPLDATLKDSLVGPDHIAMGVSSTNDNALMDMFLGLVQVLGRVKIEVIEQEK